MKKIYYITNAKIPTPRAHGIQIMEMCQAFADLGYSVELVVPDRFILVKEDPFDFHDVRRVFTIRKLWSLDTTKMLGRIGFLFGTFTFILSAIPFAFKRDGLFYTRDESLAIVLSLMGKKVAWEAHMGHQNFLVKLLVLLNLKVVVISQGLKDLYLSAGVKAENIHVGPDGADIARFDIPMTQAEAREKLNLPLEAKIILYKGTLGKWKGGDTLAEATEYLKTPNALTVFIGGSAEDEAALKARFPNSSISLLGNRPRKETPIYQKAADLLIIPNSAKEDISKLYTSPMKMFGYMASGVPIVASDIPSLREILGASDSYFFKPDDAKDLAHSIDLALMNTSDAKLKAERALEKVRAYSWKSRADNIIHFLKYV